MGGVMTALNEQTYVNDYFHTHAVEWNDLYSGDDVGAQVHRERHQLALAWIDGLGLPAGARVLEVGCGAGLLSVDLARRGLRVMAIDPVEAMVAQTRARGERIGLDPEALTVALGDATALAFPDESFDLVVALGVLPWLEDPHVAVREMARVTRRGGHVLVTDDNRYRLHSFFDPWLNPGTAALKRIARAGLARTGLYRPSGHSLGARLHSSRYTDSALADAGLAKMRGATVGFGPFTFFRRTILPSSYGNTLHHRLQRLADRQVPILRSTGSQYVVLASKASKD